MDRAAASLPSPSRPRRLRTTGAPGRPGRRARLATALGVLVLAVALATPVGEPVPADAATARPDIVLVLADDFSWNLLTPRIMPNLTALEDRGATFTRYFVDDSLCCPSRASLLTGRFPSDTGVYANRGPNGGYGAYTRNKNQWSTVATDLQAAGYRTALMGKYLNGYLATNRPAPGFDAWDVAGWGYPEYGYTLNQDGRIVRYGGPDEAGRDNYLTDVLSRLADGFVARSAAATPARPFFLEVAPFAPHSPYTPPPRYADAYGNLSYPRTPAFDAKNTDPPSWLAGFPPLSGAERATITADYRDRARSARAIDDLVGSLEATLAATGALRDTELVFTSDNGLHMGEHRLTAGKGAAFDTDVRVPLVLAGPGVARGARVSAFAENVDLRPTFDALAGTAPSEAVDGRSLVPLLATGRPPAGSSWRQGVLLEHLGPLAQELADPDHPTRFSGNPPTYRAIRTADVLFVAYRNGEREAYDLRRDPYELHNVAARLAPATTRRLEAEIARLVSCHDRPACSDVRAVPLLRR